MRRIVVPLAVAGVCATAAVPANGAGGTVRVDDFEFRAKTVRITRGATVTWRWVGDHRHNVVARGFRSTTKRSGTYRHRFAQRGTVRYRCTLHAWMTGKVVAR